MPSRVQLSREKGWRKPPGAIVVSRPSRWGNPWRIECAGSYYIVRPEPAGMLAFSDTLAAARAIATRKFLSAIGERSSRLRFDCDDIRHHLRGRDLCCWCPLDDACHADVLLEIANR